MPVTTEDPVEVARWLDHLATTDFGGRDVVPWLLAAAVKLYGKPACLRAAEVLRSACQRSGAAIVTAGFILPGHANTIETDGPPGAVALARALIRAFGTKVLLVTDPPGVPALEACARAAELEVVAQEARLGLDRVSSPAVAVCTLPFDRRRAEGAAQDILAQWKPNALIAIEKPGPNEHGIYHLVSGVDWSEHVAPSGLLFQHCPEGTATVGIGDFGNEIGMGTLRETLFDVLPDGRQCACPCGGSVFDATVVDAVVPAAISNWGAFAVAAALAVLLRSPRLFLTAAEEQRMVQAIVAAGALEGLTGAPVPGVDGVSLATDAAMVQLMGGLVEGYGNLRTPSGRKPNRAPMREAQARPGTPHEP